MLQNDYNLVWMLCHLGMLFFLMQLIPEIVWFMIVLVAGSLAGAALLWKKGLSHLDHSILEISP